MAKLKFLLFSFFAALVPALLQAQSMADAASQKVEMADGMRSNGKIYVVVAVLCFILAGIVLYLLRLEKKINRLEQGDNP